MTDDAAPAPPANLASRDLRAETIATGTLLHRVHESAYGAIYFGRGQKWRFDDPAGGYGTMYVGDCVDVAFAETMLRGTDVVAETELEIRSFSVLEVTADLLLAPLHGSAMVGIGASAAVSAGSYANAQVWSAAIHAHKSNVDGIIYRSNRDNSELVMALFDRASAKMTARPAQGILDDPALLGRILDRYNAGLV